MCPWLLTVTSNVKKISTELPKQPKSMVSGRLNDVVSFLTCRISRVHLKVTTLAKYACTSFTHNCFYRKFIHGSDITLCNEKSHYRIMYYRCHGGTGYTGESSHVCWSPDHPTLLCPGLGGHIPLPGLVSRHLPSYPHPHAGEGDHTGGEEGV